MAEVVILDVVGAKFTVQQNKALIKLVDFINEKLSDVTEVTIITYKKQIPGPRFEWVLRKDVRVSQLNKELREIRKLMVDIIDEHFEGKSGKLRLLTKEAGKEAVEFNPS